MSEFFRPILLNAFQEQHWPEITRCAVTGIAQADNLIAASKILNWQVGRDQRGDLRRIGVMHALFDACKSSKLPFLCAEKSNTLGNCHHIELSSQNVNVHIIHTNRLLDMPRDTPLRQNERMTNQSDLFMGTLFTTDLSLVKKWYAYLTFNADEKGKLTHLGLGMTDKNGDEWIDLMSILRHSDEDYETPTDEPKPPGPEELMKFQPHVQEAVEKSDKDSARKDKTGAL